jgi:DNA-binding LacI/PurR family transcriptional regulator
VAVPGPDTGRRVTAVDVAHAAGVSRATVGFVLNDTPGQTISEGTRQRVLRAAELLGYRPNSAARALASGRSRIILFVLPDWPVEFRLRHYLDEATLALDKAGYSLVTYSRPGQVSRPLWESLNPDLVIGPTPFSASDVASMVACGVRQIYPDPNRPGGLDLSLTIDSGPELQVDHLHERGHRKLVFAALAGGRASSLVAARHGAAQAQARALGLPTLDLKHVDHPGIVPAESSTADALTHSPTGVSRTTGKAAPTAEDALRGWLAAGITGVVAFDDDAAAAIAGAAVRARIRMPADLAIVGHGDSPLATMFVPALSSVRTDSAARGRAFADFTLHKVAGRPLPVGRLAPKPTVVRRETS